MDNKKRIVIPTKKAVTKLLILGFLKCFSSRKPRKVGSPANHRPREARKDQYQAIEALKDHSQPVEEAREDQYQAIEARKDHSQAVEAREDQYQAIEEASEDQYQAIEEASKDQYQAAIEFEGQRALYSVESNESHCSESTASNPEQFYRTRKFASFNTMEADKYRHIVVRPGPIPEDREEIGLEREQNCQALESVPMSSTPRSDTLFLVIMSMMPTLR